MVAVMTALAADATASMFTTTLFATVSANRSAVPTFTIRNVCTPDCTTAIAPAYRAENVAENVWNTPPDATEKSMLVGEADTRPLAPL